MSEEMTKEQSKIKVVTKEKIEEMIKEQSKIKVVTKEKIEE